MTGTDIGLLLFRVGYGGMLIWLHGWNRLGRAFDHVVGSQPWGFVGVVEQMGLPLPTLFAVASALAESVVAALLVAGLFSRVAAGIIAVNFAVATISEAAKGDPFELPALYLLGALVLLVTGPGPLSIDRPDSGRRRW